MRGRELTAEQFEQIAKALADPRRVAVLETIARATEYPCTRLCEDFPVSKATISHHTKELLRAGLVEARREGQFIYFRARRDTIESYTAELLRRTGGWSAKTGDHAPGQVRSEQ